MTNLQKLMSDEEELAICLMCPYIPGEKGAHCKSGEQAEKASYQRDCKPCIKEWLHSEARE